MAANDIVIQDAVYDPVGRDVDGEYVIIANLGSAPGPASCDEYETLVGETPGDLRGSRFSDFEWLREESGAIHLSAVTSVPDNTPVRFTVIRCEGRVPDPLPDSSTTDQPPGLGPVLAQVDGQIRGGVAFARWTPPAGEDPLDPEGWIVDHDIPLEIEDEEDHAAPAAGDPSSPEALLAADGMHPPVFLVQAGPHWALSGPPGARLDRLHFLDEDEAEGVVLGSDGRLTPISIRNGRVQGAGATPILGVAVAKRRVALAADAPPAPPALPPSMPPIDPPRWAPILRSYMSSATTLRTDNAVKFLVDGAATFPEMVAAMRTAQSAEHYIYLLGWILKDGFELIPGDSTTPVQRLFADAASRGVQVRAMLWDQPLTQNSAEVDRINRLPTGAAILDNATPAPIASFGSHHQKVLVIKGSQGLITFCGGIDINDDRLRAVNSGRGEPLHDVHCRVVGPAALDVFQTFIRRWDHHPDHANLDRTRGALLGRAEPVPAPITAPAPAPADSSTGRTCAVTIARTFNPVAPGSTVPRERDIQALLVGAIRNAQSFIYMEDQYLINPLAAVELNMAIPRLQHLTVVTSASEFLSGSGASGSGGVPCAWKLRREFIALLTAGLSTADRAKVRVFILITPPPRTPPVLLDHTYVHAKTWVFDDELAVIGSANCNRRSWTHDSEVNAFVFDDAAVPAGTTTFAQQLRMQLWAEHLTVAPGAVTDGVASASLWLAPPAGAHIMPYNPTAGTDTLPDSVCNAMRNTIDPYLP
jgi:phosphatidylserine/phosphatidylglycerophosphate/cardiolipin synthase-like enzyme